jgi:BirA family biotin operon repressor/biotin-[acetyl-CoA-carboxylase] ligase
MMISQLNAESIRAPISGPLREQLDFLEVFSEIESTNSYLLEQPPPAPGRFRVALAEHQTAGRGQMDKQWYSPGSSGLCLSMSYTFASMRELQPCLTLAIGIGTVQALEKLGARGIGLKWPNDLIVRDGKLGGILTEARSATRDQLTIITGVGINYDLRGNPDAAEITSRLGHVSDLSDCMTGMPSRSTASIALIEGLFNTLAEFEADGFGRFAEAWEKYDWLRGQRVIVDRAGDRIRGVCQGIDSDGALVLQTNNGRQRLISGSVTFGGQQAGQSGGKA